ncbi:hypothetical protein HanHA300_Chr08g0296381 [Helianthus annuus]|nr:hypothetical protein HanHA300_Chr08g0296381 [Helianthus annuus]KAJ0555018.1 hypothetical protein HanHA89_Chr08g0314891 [Helianthus annuus]KAJ0720586.1 hypothetical protein HanLR1_Chr08g0295251 [Helianthus annuus]KAJ0723780.1 hypothetical protein HanOQP8_Chr08g0302411 [Helianthus annuus]
MSKFTRFNANELDARARYELLQTRPEEYPRQACTDLLTLVNQLDRFNNIVTGPLRVALTTRLRSVHQCTMEFYSTFTFTSRCDPFDNEGVAFRCGGTNYSISMAQFGAIVGLYAEEESGNEENTGGLRDLDENDRQAAWAQIGEGIYNPSSTKSTKLRDPLYRYIHRLLTYSLSQRHDSSGVVGLKDLVVLHGIHNRRALDVPYLLLRNMHLNRLARAPTPIFFGGWVYRLFKHFTCIPRSFERNPWSGRVDYHICRAMNLLYEVEDGSVSFQRMQGHAWNPQEALVLHAPPPHYQYQPHGDPGQSSSQGGCFPNFQSLHDLLQENLMCTRNTYNLANNTYHRVGAIERNINDIQDDIGSIREYMAGHGDGGDDSDEDMD